MCSKLISIRLLLTLLMTTPGLASEGKAMKAAAQFSVNAERASKGPALEEIEFGLASALLQAGLPLAALKQFEKIVNAGSSHLQYNNAISALSKIANRKDIELLLSQLLMRLYEKDPAAFASLDIDDRQQVNYLLANRLFRIGKTSEARRLAESVSVKHARYAAARYLLALDSLNLKTENDSSKDYAGAIANFEAVRKAIPASETKADLFNLRNMATLGIARAYYEQGYALPEEEPNRRLFSKKAIETYREIPRFSAAWDHALFEMGWAYTIAEEYGDALGAIRSLAHPHFTGAYYPEAEILSAIVYWYNCQWDRANHALKQWNDKYLPLAKSLKERVATRQSNAEWNDLEGTGGLLAEKIKKDPQYRVFETLIEAMRQEKEMVNKDEALKSSPLAGQLNEYYSRATIDVKKAAKNWSDQMLKDVLADLESVRTRGSIISLETKTAEAQWLEHGRQITGLKRGRLARPYIPVDRDQFWWVSNSESWKDELGFYRLSVKSECNE